MTGFFNRIIPNVMDKLPDFFEAIRDITDYGGMVRKHCLCTGAVPGNCHYGNQTLGGILENKVLYQILDKLINFFRSIPFIILLTWVIPISRAIMGTAINVEGAIVPLIMGTVPFFSRQVESALAETDHGLIEAALSMGSGPLEIIFRVYLRESVSAIARGTTITAISLVGLTAMAGAVGSGGLGDFAIRYGHDRNMTDVTWVTVITVFILVSIIQLLGNLVVKKSRH